MALAQETDGASAVPAWAKELQDQLAHIDSQHEGELGVYVEDVATGVAVSLRADEQWYLASGIKVPVAIAVLRKIERGELALDSKVLLLESDYVDGAGPTNWYKPNSALTVEYLLEQMLTVSDNTASDILIRIVGLKQVNELIAELVPSGLSDVTSLADVRRLTYGGFHKSASTLSGKDFLTLRGQSQESKRLAALAEILGVNTQDFALADLDSAFRAYYATNYNAGTLRAYGALLDAVASGEALEAAGTQYLLNLLANVKTGDARIKAGLPGTVSFAHKTGTQHRRACDLGIALPKEQSQSHSQSADANDDAPQASQRPRVIINACSREFTALADAERAFRAIGKAVSESGVFEPDQRARSTAGASHD